MFDTHTHLTDEAFDNDIDEVIGRAKEEGVDYILCCGWDIDSSRECLNLAQNYEGIYAAVGVHPHTADKKWDLKEIEKLLTNKKVKAVGEIGLDFYKNYAKEENQIRIFKEQIRIAKKFGLPMSIHLRKAHKDGLKILKEENYFSGVMHCFSGDEADLYQALDLGFYISFAGPVTYKLNRLELLVKKVPLNRLLMETDSPLLTPHPNRGKRNEPSYLRYIAEKVSEIKGIDIKEPTEENGKGCFKILS